MSWDEILKGTSGGDVISGGSGDDYLQGKAGGDALDGGAGNDQIHGDSGDDHLRGGEGDDHIHGGEGTDTAYYSGSVTEYTFTINGDQSFNLWHTGGSQIDGNDWLQHVERLVFADAIIDLTQNNAPIAYDDSASTDEDVGTYSSGSTSVLDNDFDWEGDSMSVTPGTFTGSFGTLVMNADGTYTYTPFASAQTLDDGESVQDSFSYTVSDGSLTDTGTLTITIAGLNDAPVANDDTNSTTEDAAVSGNVLANDTDVDDEPLTVANAGTYVGNYGTLELAADGSYTYTPNAAAQALDDGESAQDSFGYTATDGTASDTAMLTITVDGLNDAPVANDDTNSTTEDSAVSGNVLANDTDVDDEPLTVANPGSYAGAYGTLTLAADGSYTYTPNAAAQGLDDGEVVSDSFGYTASDGTASDTATLTIDVAGLNDAPVANDDTNSTSEDAAVSGNVLANDTDVDGETLTVTNPGSYAGAYGSLTLAADGSYTYTPNATANGLAAGESAQDAFTYTASDGTESDGATLTVTVNGANDAPTIDAGGTDAEGSVTELPNNDPNENTATHSDSGTIAFDDVDVTDTHTASFTPQGGSYLGTFTLDPVDDLNDNAGWNFSVSDADLDSLDEGETVTQTYTVEIDDGNGGSVTQDVTITITGAADQVPPDGTNWYIDNSAVGSANTGSPSDPFTSIAAFNAAQGTPGGPGVDDNVFLLTGTGTGVYAEADGINLLDGQTLTGVPTGAVRPTIEATAGDGIDVAENNTISGVDVGTVSGIGIDDDGGTVGTLTITDVGIASGGGQIVDIDNGGTLAVTLNSAASTGSSGGAIDLAGVAGSFTVTGATTIVGVHSGGGVDVTGSSASVSLSGGGTISTGANTAVNFTGNSGSLEIGGGLDIVTTSGAGLVATGGGSVTFTGAGNSVASTTGVAVTISGTVIGAAGVTLDSVSSNGAASGIVLANTGAGAFSVTGTGLAGSGGAILASTGAGIDLTNTGPVSLTDVAVSGGADDGIRGTGVDGLALIRATVANNGDAAGEHGVDLAGLTGISTVTDSAFTGSAADNFHLVNAVGTLDLTVTGSTFGNSLGATANDGLFIQANGTALIRASVTDSTFVNNRGDHFQFTTDVAATSTSHITFSDNILTSNDSAVVGGGITLSPAGAADLFFAVQNNDIQGARSSAIVATMVGSTAAGEVHGTITGNTIGTAAVANSGSAFGDGISTSVNGHGTMTVLIEANEIHQWNSNGISAVVRSGGGRMNATIEDNVLQDPGAFALRSILVQSGAATGDFGQIYLEMNNNVADTPILQDVRLWTRFNGDILMPGYAGGAGDTVAVDAFMTAKNPLAGDIVVLFNALAGSGYFDTPGSAPVPLPIVPDMPMM